MVDFSSILDVLNFAIHLEQASAQFYQHLSQTTLAPSLSEFFESLAREEQLHEQRLEKLLEQSGEIASKPISLDEVQGYIKAIESGPIVDYKQAVKLALDKEKSAQMLYSLIGGVVEDPALKQMFLDLSEQERMHREFFEKEHRRIEISEN